ncbi:hypothetical protein ACUN0C_04575 [Faunimonas sp. B44]|uniref:hypothetical protein n=1 Tax=Faunimonas sp. B44 TaxID=3461493 RepID=UPI004043A3D2
MPEIVLVTAAPRRDGTRQPKQRLPAVWRPAVLLAVLLALVACSEDGDRPYLEVAGGGFVFNYRNAEASYGLVLKPLRPLPEGSTVEARFEDPAGGEPIVVRTSVVPGRDRIMLDSKPVRGIRKGQPYGVLLTLSDASGRELQRLERTYASRLDQAVLPEQPLAIGPGYQRNIDRSATPFPPSLNRSFPEPAK